jgi:hypothetical protein
VSYFGTTYAGSNESQRLMENPVCEDLNYDDTEEPLSQEGIDKCHLFDMDIE